MQLSIVIVNWHSRAFLDRCLASVRTSASGILHETVVIDSGSFDGCEQMVRGRYPEVRFIQSAENLGFAKANNQAFEACLGDCVLFLNPDTEAVGPAIADLYRAYGALPNVGAAGPTLLNGDGTPQFGSIRSLPTIWNRVFASDVLKRGFQRISPRARPCGQSGGNGEAGDSARKEPQEVEAVSGACLMIARAAFQRVGRFSEDYFMYAEDMDLSYKLRKAGFRNYLVPRVHVVHHGGGSSQGAGSAFSAVMLREATWRFFRKTRGAGYSGAYRVATCAAALVRLSLLIGAWPFCRTEDAAVFRARALGKWSAILRWTIHRSPVVRQYYASREAAPVLERAL